MKSITNAKLKNFTILFFLAILILTSSLSVLADQEKYIGFWKPGTGINKVLKFDSWEEFTQEWTELGKKDMRLQDLEVLKGAEGVKYIGTWVVGKGKYALLAHDSYADFADAFKEMYDEDKTKQLIDVEVVALGGKNHYIGVWYTGKGGSAMFMYNSWADFTAKWNEMAKDGRVLIDVEAFQNGSNAAYVGVWETGVGKDQRLYKTDDYAEFDKQWKAFNKEDLRLVDIDTSEVKGVATYIGVWNKGTGGQFLGTANSFAELQATTKTMNAKQLDLVDFAAINFGKPAQPKPPQGKPAQQGKPANTGTLAFSQGQTWKKDPVSGFEFPADMPAINYPEFDGCNTADRKMVEQAWAKAHHHAWRAVQLFVYLDKAGDRRDDIWKAGFNPNDPINVRMASYSPNAFFGGYEGGTYNYDFIRDAILLNWEKRFKTKMTIKCRRDDGGAHPCYQNNPGGDGPPSANHIRVGVINFCNKFFDDTFENKDRNRVRTVLHENFHWLAPNGLAILDTHTHWDRNSKGRCRADTEKGYGLDEVMHFATSKGCWNDGSFHRGDAARNNDTYAYFIRNLGEAVYSKKLQVYPTK